MHIVNVACALSQQYETIAEAAKRLNIPADRAKIFEKFFGLKKLPIDLAKTVDEFLWEAANDCLNQVDIQRHQVKYVIHAHTATVICPFGQNHLRQLQRRLGLDQAIAFSTSMSKCSSVFVLFKMMQELFVHLHHDDYILILTGDVSFTEILQFIPGTTITTDGAGAILLAKQHDKNTLLHVQIESYGEFAGGIWDEKAQQQIFEVNYSHYLSQVISNCLDQAILSLQDIKVILPHNVNTLSWHGVIRRLGIHAEKVYLKNVAETSHCFGTDPFFNYQTALAEKRILSGDYFMLAAVGLGAVFAVMVLKH